MQKAKFVPKLEANTRCPECRHWFTSADISLGVCSACGGYTLSAVDGPVVGYILRDVEKVEKK